MEIFILYVSNISCEGFLQTLTLMMCVECSSYVYTLMRGIGGGSMKGFTPALSHWPLFIIDVLVSVDGFNYVTHSHFVKFFTH